MGEVISWHYFDETEDFCWLKTIGNSRAPKCLCGRPADEVERHTEDRRQVSCIICLHRIVKMEEREP